MKNITLAAGFLAATCAAPLAASIQSCPSGQILRVSSGVCQPKSAEAVRWLKPGGAKPTAEASAGAAAVGRPLRSGSPDSRPPARVGSKVAAMASVRQPLIPQQLDPRSGVATAAATASFAKGKADTAPHSAAGAGLAPKLSREFGDERADPKAAAPGETEPRPAGVTPEPVRPLPEWKAATVLNAPVRATPAEEIGQPAPSSVAAPPQPQHAATNVAQASQPPAATEAETAVGSRSNLAMAALRNDAASPAQQPRAESTAAAPMTTATLAAPETTGTISQSRAAEPNAVDPGLVDWGDESQLVAALRANWRAMAAAHTFRVGEQVPVDVWLQALPHPYAGRDHGLNMRYLIANGDAVLVLPTLRVVVEVHSDRNESPR